jgi:hypothetical protein
MVTGAAWTCGIMANHAKANGLNEFFIFGGVREGSRRG